VIGSTASWIGAVIGSNGGANSADARGGRASDLDRSVSRPRVALALALLLGLGLSSACAAPPAAVLDARPASIDRHAVVSAALAQIGTPYRYGGHSPGGFDCSGLVLYSYRQAGMKGLPHSVAALSKIAEPVSMGELRPGDLLFFTGVEKKTSHVAIYVGDDSFVHAPSSGGSVEKVPFSHVYWSQHLGRAGRLVH
jgi:cell wall-associated NlpC family hydrolase